uniref:Glucosamine 6-phosphate N-acetyltransferase n=1 Tax=Caligus rogercresseyi TaxID=217165 RepID=C1BNX1_CALRO|nr:Probable glucosamine 6-phosphate N-acetyltransferase [Caligus rogercresseyi]
MTLSKESEEISLFDSEILESLDFSSSSAVFNPPITSANPGPGLRVRALQSGDDQRGFLTLLTQFTKVGDISRDEFLRTFNAMREKSGTYYIVVIEDLEKGEIIGAATLLIEQKFIRHCAKKGCVEDVVVNSSYRGRQLGKLIVVTLNLLAKALGCYKVSLNCTDSMIRFYEGVGYAKEEGNGNFLVIRL